MVRAIRKEPTTLNWPKDHRQLRRYGPEPGAALAQDRIQYRCFELRRLLEELRFPAYAAGLAIITRL